MRIIEKKSDDCLSARLLVLYVEKNSFRMNRKNSFRMNSDIICKGITGVYLTNVCESTNGVQYGGH